MLASSYNPDSLTIKAVAEQVGVHPVTLSSAFPKYYRCTIGHYVRQLRVVYAGRELVETETPLSEIALAGRYCFWQSNLSVSTQQKPDSS